jgi:hypothetical protein
MRQSDVESEYVVDFTDIAGIVGSVLVDSVRLRH